MNSRVPVINALSSLYHPTQILADLLTLMETYSPGQHSLDALKGLNVAWVGDSNNILNDMIVSFSRLGINLSIATPKGYALEERVINTADEGLKKEHGSGKRVHVNNPESACKNADVVVTDTWFVAPAQRASAPQAIAEYGLTTATFVRFARISMGQEGEKAQRMRDFSGFQVTMDLMRRSGANADWKFMHCLPRKPQEVDDEVFYSDRSLVFPEAENRKSVCLLVDDLTGMQEAATDAPFPFSDGPSWLSSKLTSEHGLFRRSIESQSLKYRGKRAFIATINLLATFFVHQSFTVVSLSRCCRAALS